MSNPTNGVSQLPDGIGFTAEDFTDLESYYDLGDRKQNAADCANAKLPALFEAWVKREGVKVFNFVDEDFGEVEWGPNRLQSDTHTGYVVLIKKLSDSNQKSTLFGEEPK